jgi:GMP synthase-like glutamine amidotransferase
MKKNIGLLVCDTVNPEAAKFTGQYWDRFNAFFANADSKIKLIKYDIRNDEWPDHPEDCDGYVITGCGLSANDPDQWITDLIRFIRECYVGKVRMVGICFGHQAIAKAMGGSVELNPNGWGLGIKQQKVVKKQPWMKPTAKKFNVIASHKEHVVELPGNAELLFVSDHCKITGFEISNIFLGFQGHPENSSFTSGASIDTRKEVLDPEVYRLAKESLIVEADQKLIANWINNFFHQK